MAAKKERKLEKKAWIRIVEAFIAVMIVASALIYLVSKQTNPQESQTEIFNIEKAVLNEIAMSENLREKVLISDNQSINDFAKRRIPNGMQFEIRICEVDSVCGASSIELGKQVYTDEILISSTLKIYSPKKLKIFIMI
jgi:cell division protein FtsL